MMKPSYNYLEILQRHSITVSLETCPFVHHKISLFHQSERYQFPAGTKVCAQALFIYLHLYLFFELSSRSSYACHRSREKREKISPQEASWMTSTWSCSLLQSLKFGKIFLGSFFVVVVVVVVVFKCVNKERLSPFYLQCIGRKFQPFYCYFYS